MSTFRLELSHAIRALRRSPYVTVAAVTSIGLGVGAATTVFSWMDGVLFHPFPSTSNHITG